MALLWALVIAHWIRWSITYEIRTCRRFSRDWPIDRSPNHRCCRHPEGYVATFTGQERCLRHRWPQDPAWALVFRCQRAGPCLPRFLSDRQITGGSIQWQQIYFTETVMWCSAGICLRSSAVHTLFRGCHSHCSETRSLYPCHVMFQSPADVSPTLKAGCHQIGWNWTPVRQNSPGWVLISNSRSSICHHCRTRTKS